MSNSPQIQLRNATKEDLPFILNSYLKSYRDAPLNRQVTDRLYYKNHVEFVNTAIHTPGSRVIVACNSEHPDQIFGYFWFTETDSSLLAHWIYVKLPFRRFKIASTLLAALPADKKRYYTHFNVNWGFFRQYQADYLPWYYKE